MSDRTNDLTLDHFTLEDTRVTRRYFDKFEKITGYLGKVAAVMEVEGRYQRHEISAIARTLGALNLTFRTLGYKYHFSGRAAHAGKLTFDRIESGLRDRLHRRGRGNRTTITPELSKFGDRSI